MIVLGIDPGNSVTGYGIVRSTQSDYECLDFGTIRLKSQWEFHYRLKYIYNEVISLIHHHQPDAVAFEDIFYSRNIKAALQLGQARGAAMIAAINTEKLISIYSPKEIKQALTGNGSAAKEQVQMMTRRLLRLQQPIIPLDASDALAIAICYSNRYWTQQKFMTRQS
jgi:crossover junction endodeoxyribonuclease RuvC